MGNMNLRSIITTLFGGPAPTRGLSLPTILSTSYTWSDEAAMKVSAVYSAVTLISEGVARLTLTLQRYNGARKCFVDDYNAPLYSVLRTQPNTYTSSFDLWRAAIAQKLLHGNAYLMPSKVGDDVVELTLLSPGSVTFDAQNRVYIVNDAINGVTGKVQPSGIIHLRNIGVDGGLTGLSTIQQAGYALGILRQADSNTATTLSNGGRICGILTGSSSMPTMGDASVRQLRDMAEQVEESIASGHVISAVPGDMKFQPITLSPADAKVLESKQFTIRDVSRFFRVHPSLLYEETNNTYKSAEVPNVMFLTQTLAPLLKQIETELLIKLVPRVLWGRRRIRFDREELYTTDLSTESAYFEKSLQTGVYTVNELRVKKGQPPVPGGDTPMVSANLKGLATIISESNTINNESNNG